MPLVILCGLPCSGKSKTSSALREHFSALGKSVRVVSDTDLAPRKNLAYADSKSEKEVRAALKTAVERELSDDVVVVLDSLNYIKGYRYELYCISKHNKTPHCVIHCATPIDICRQWNSQCSEEQRYRDDIFEGLILRFEEPNSMNRWDSPLFTINVGDSLPCDSICQAIFERKAPPPNQSTQSQPISAPNFLHDLDKVTQDVIKSILEQQKSLGPGSIKIPGSSETLRLDRLVSMAELRRHKKQFITYTKTHPVSKADTLISMFVQYLDNCL
ncbi:protein KTI12 homolog [Oscarella lobularis]|uniref:protein KTI12 homolog n=1 Tax=Oscarella lobularis TaxID=121494 RepID=UPI0033137061